MGQIKDKYLKKNFKIGTIAANVLKVLVDDEEATLAQLNKIYHYKELCPFQPIHL
jgi:hypothetical protein